MARGDAGEVGKGWSCGVLIRLIKELGLYLKNNGKPFKSFKWSRNTEDLYCRKSSMAAEWTIKNNSEIDWVTG